MAVDKTRRRTKQVNVRLTAEENDILAALVFLEECSAPEVLRPVITAFLAQQHKDPQVQEALHALEERRARKSGRVASLRKPQANPTSAGA